MKKLVFSLAAVAMAAVASVNVYNVNANAVEMSDLQKENVEALAGCEIVKKGGDVIFLCVGEEGRCSDSRLGYTLICSGKNQ